MRMMSGAMRTHDGTPVDPATGWLEAAVMALALGVLGAILADRAGATTRCNMEPAASKQIVGASTRPAPSAMEADLHEMLTHD
jgi:hypothetical protein